MKSAKLNQLLNIKYPIIQAPMFLVSNTTMVIEAMKSGIAGCIPALNYRTLDELRAAIKELKAVKVEGGSFGFNLIVNKSNIKYKGQLAVICEEGCDFIITSLGSPEETIKQAHKAGIKVFCDVVDLKFAQKVEDLGADAIIAVNNEAGGHRGNRSPEELIKELVSDGVLVSTPAGSTAYNFSVGGRILNLESPRLAITPISPFRPRGWRGGIVSNKSKIIIKNLDKKKRPVSAVSDNTEIRNAHIIKIGINTKIQFKLLYNKKSGLVERNIAEQFKF